MNKTLLGLILALALARAPYALATVDTQDDAAVDPEWACDHLVINKACEVVKAPTAEAVSYPALVVYPGERVRCHIVVQNGGRCDLRNIRIVDFLPRGVDFKEASDDPVHKSDQKVVWKRDLDSGRQAEFYVTFEIDRTHRDFLTENKACAFSNRTEQSCDSWNLLIKRRDNTPAE